MNVVKFDTHYYYTKNSKVFAHSLGIGFGNFRKFESDALFSEFLITRKVATRAPALPRKKGHLRDEIDSNANAETLEYLPPGLVFLYLIIWPTSALQEEREKLVGGMV